MIINIFLKVYLSINSQLTPSLFKWPSKHKACTETGTEAEKHFEGVCFRSTTVSNTPSLHLLILHYNIRLSSLSLVSWHWKAVPILIIVWQWAGTARHCGGTDFCHTIHVSVCFIWFSFPVWKKINDNWKSIENQFWSQSCFPVQSNVCIECTIDEQHILLYKNIKSRINIF